MTKHHSKIENSDIKKEFPDLMSLMSSKEAKKNSNKKKSLKKRNKFYKQVQ